MREGSDLTTVQTPFISDAEVRESIEIAKQRCAGIVRTNLPEIAVEQFIEATQDLHPLSDWYRDCVKPDPERESATTAGMIKVSIETYFAPEPIPEGHQLIPAFLRSKGHAPLSTRREGKTGKYWDITVASFDTATEAATGELSVSDDELPDIVPVPESALSAQSYPMEMSAR